MRYDGIDCRYYQINNRISKQGKNVSNLRYSPSPFTFLHAVHYPYFITILIESLPTLALTKDSETA